MNKKSGSRITLVISSLGAGGAERVMVNLAGWLVEAGREVTLITFDRQPPAYAVDARIRLIRLDILRDSSALWKSVPAVAKRIRTIRRAILDSRPDIVISFIDRTNVRVLLSLETTHIPTIVVERTNPFAHLPQVGKPWNYLRSLTYPRASAVVLLTEQSRDFFATSLQDKIRIIPNAAISPPEPLAGSLPDRPDGIRQHTVITVGRLAAVKAHDLLIEAFAQISHQFPDWGLTIIGGGELMSKLEQQSAKLGIREKVCLPGHQQDPYRWMQAADIFVLTSQYEGFPNALVEGMACGLPAISFDCRTGPREIIRPWIDGLLVPPQDVESLAAALALLMSQDALRARMAAAAPDVLERFSRERIMGMWDALIDEVTIGENGPG